MTMTEHEIKVPVAALEPIRDLLRARGAKLRNPMTLEDNLVLDDGAGTLLTAGRVLRVRSWGSRWTVTFKGPANFRDGIKSRPEM
jgi:adenylate cyclase class IV